MNSELFSENLFGGVEECVNRLNEGKHTIKDMISVLSERAEVEELYSKALSKMAKTAAANSDYATEKGSIGDAWNTVKESLDGIASNSLQLSSSIMKEIVKSLASFKQLQGALKQSLISDAAKLTKGLDKHTQELNKAKSKYYKASKDAEAAQVAYEKAYTDVENSNPMKDFERANSTAMEADEAKLRYEQVLEAMKEFTAIYNEKLKGILNDFQHLEEERIQFVKSCLEKYLTLQNQSITAASQMLDQQSAITSDISVENDLGEWVEEHKTGLNPLNAPTFEAYETQFEHVPLRQRSKALYDYSAQEDNELTFKKDDIILVHNEDESGWWTGEIGDKIGLFPGNYVEKLEITDIAAAAEATPSEKVAQVMSKTIRNLSGSIRRRSFGLKKKKTVKAVYDYAPQNPDELCLKEGDILVVESEHEGWYSGCNENGENGLFPSNYVAAV